MSDPPAQAGYDSPSGSADPEGPPGDDPAHPVLIRSPFHRTSRIIPLRAGQASSIRSLPAGLSIRRRKAPNRRSWEKAYPIRWRYISHPPFAVFIRAPSLYIAPARYSRHPITIDRGRRGAVAGRRVLRSAGMKGYNPITAIRMQTTRAPATWSTPRII